MPPPPSRSQSNASTHEGHISRAREGVFTDWFVRHCGGWNEIACMSGGVYDRQMVHAGMGGVAAQRAEWEKLANTARFEIYGTMEAEFAHVLRSGVYGTK